MKIHPVFHVSLLEAFSNDPVPGQISPPPPPIVVNYENENTIEEIYNSRIAYHNRLQYLVKWTGEMTQRGNQRKI